MEIKQNPNTLVLEGRYELTDIIGEGGMAVVYKALDRRLNRYVAVKIMRPEMAQQPEFRQRFFAESQAVAMLSSPNIVAVYDVSHSTEIEYIVMELVDGITLKQYMERKGPIPWREAVYFAKQIARALAHAHARGVVHRDIKPQNMLLLRDGTLKVGDFGIAALENEMREERGTAVGSIHYIAPEQIRGESPDGRSDLYSLGVVMYEMLTGRKPYTGDTVGEIAVKHMNTSAVPPSRLVPDLPPELEHITLKAMNANIFERYQNAEELIKDLDRFTLTQTQQEDEAEAGSLELPPVVPVRSVSEMSKESFRRRRRRSSRVSFLSGTFGVLLVVLGLFIFLLQFFFKDYFPDKGLEDRSSSHMIMPNFQGQSVDTILKDPQNSVFSFEIIYLNSSGSEEFNPSEYTVERQDPGYGNRISLKKGGTPVKLYVSTSVVQIPDVFNLDYRQATSTLRVSGYYVEIVDELSDTVPRNLVMGMSPPAGTPLEKGQFVTLTVSAGPEIEYISMPNLVGLSERAAIEKIENSELSYAYSEYERSDLPAETVIGQDVEGYSLVPSHSKVILRVSTGPEV
ncbi:MAG: Stk1 family PASTA domain-containing Ser/Thr kinase [Oscillospiraceae bacterium]|nr:Stk1 family PASTA domain-containing Ser/Thr kinase [Oscillospiraceae bacterium]